MPRGTEHVEQGMLLMDRGQLVLERACGETWRLDAGWRVHRLIGRRVRIVGIRADFNLLDVKSATPF
jgi:hypothetical protein